MEPLISSNQWHSAKRVLYMTHLAIGDYYYQRGFLAELKRQYPHIELDIWIDDCRSRPKEWHAGRNQVLGQWLDTETHIGRYYPIAASKTQRKDIIAKAQQQNYDIVVFYAATRTENFAKIARQISPTGWIAGTKTKPKQKWLKKHLAFKGVDACMNLDDSPQVAHINDKYRIQLSALFGVRFDPNMPVETLTVPQAQQVQMQAWVTQFKERSPKTQKLVLINPLSTTPKRDLSWSHLVQLIQGIAQQDDAFGFVLSLPPAELEPIKKLIAETKALNALNIDAFSATEHFFQLPALLSLSDIVITVETAVMHLASGLSARQLVLMRESAKQWQPKNTSKVLYGRSIVDDIPVSEMLTAFNDIITE